MVALSIVVGIALGLVAGFFRGVTEIAIMRLMDIILTLPSLLLAIVIVAILGPGLMNAMLAVAVVVLPHYVRITRAAVIAEMSKDYVTAARASGAGALRLMFSEVLPNCAAPLIVQASLGVSTAILDAAALGFLGLGAQPPSPEWGTMLADAREFVLRAWWVVTFPGPDDPAHRARVQPARRRPARRARSEAEALECAADGTARNRGPRTSNSRPRAACMHAVDGVSLSLDEGDVLGIVGESGSGKSVDDAGASWGSSPIPGRVRAQRLRFAGHDLLGISDTRAPPHHRQGRGDDLPGADDQPEPLLHDRLPARGDAAAAPRAWTAGAARKRAIELLEQVGIPARGEPRSTTFRTSCRAA